MYQVAALISPGKIVLQSRSYPDLGDNEVLVRMAWAGVCGTDLAIFSGHYQVALPLVLGHEFSGRVEDVGSRVSRKLLGKLVTAEINNSCLAYRSLDPCPACARGLPTHCAKRTTLGIWHWDGAFAEFIRVPVGNIHILPPEISPKEGIFVEPLAAAIQTFELTKINPGDTVVILGIGRLGTLICAVANAQGVRTIAVSRSRDKLERGKRYGAGEVIDSSIPDPITRVKEITSGLGADIVVDATGSPQGLELALNMVRPRGVIILKTTSGVLAQGLDVTRIAVDEIRIQGSRCGPFDKAIAMLKDKKIDVEPLISAVYPLRQTEQAIRAAARESKVLIENRL
ncbi:MAG: D-arabitol-phosphate dehydrogenase [Actinobacteria bacterium]|nr:D-arabitol-phosphate dehydrogenase [Actinomycetota bacterium]